MLGIAPVVEFQTGGKKLKCDNVFLRRTPVTGLLQTGILGRGAVIATKSCTAFPSVKQRCSIEPIPNLISVAKSERKADRVAKIVLNGCICERVAEASHEVVELGRPKTRSFY